MRFYNLHGQLTISIRLITRYASGMYHSFVKQNSLPFPSFHYSSIPIIPNNIHTVGIKEIQYTIQL